jgi:NADH-quinone oxidoreductase subunit J
MAALFYVASVVAVLATILGLTRLDVVHGLLYLVVSLLAVAVAFFALGAPFVAAIEVIVYAGAIIVLFIYVVMMLGLAGRRSQAEQGWLRPRIFVGPGLLCAVLAAELIGLVHRDAWPRQISGVVASHDVGVALYGPYLVGVELASMLLLGALVGAHHLGRRSSPEEAEHDGDHTDGARLDAGHDSVRAGTDRPAGP